MGRRWHQERGDFARLGRTAWRLTSSKTDSLLFLGSIVIFPKESADSVNHPLPGERVAAPARNIHLQNNSFPGLELPAQTLAESRGTDEAGETQAGGWGRGADSSPPPLCPRGGWDGCGDPSHAALLPGTRGPAGGHSARASVRGWGGGDGGDEPPASRTQTGPGDGAPSPAQSSPGTHRSGRCPSPR